MPRTRSDVDRDVKVDEILDAAERVLRAGGDDALSLKALAAELGVARGALYWYFPSKDDLFVAVVARVLASAFADPPARGDHVRRISWAVEQLAVLQPLTRGLHDRAVAGSEAAAALEDAYQRELCARLRAVLAPVVSAPRVAMAADTVVMFVEGLLTRPLDAAGRRRHLRFLLDALTDP